MYTFVFTDIDLYSIIPFKYVSVKEFLHTNLNNDASSKMYKYN